MGNQEFGSLVRRAAGAKGLSQGRLGYLLTQQDPDGPLLDAKQAGLIYQGKRRPTRKLIESLIDVLAPHLDPAEAWAAAGLLPPGMTADMLRKLDMFASRHPAAAAAGPGALTHRSGKPQAHVKGLGQLIPFTPRRRPHLAPAPVLDRSAA